MTVTSGPVHAFLAGIGPDGAGRRLYEVVEFDDARIEGVHDFIQWCFPLQAASRAVPGAPVLSAFEAKAIREDILGHSGIVLMLSRMFQFYRETDGWLRAHDHNHLRITRIIASLRDLVGQHEAKTFHDFVIGRNAEAGAPINDESIGFWMRALEGR